MEREKIDYQDVIDLGFKRTDCEDNVFFKQNGYCWFLVQIISKHFVFDWDSETHFVNLVRYSKNIEKDISASRMATIEIQSMEELKMYLDFITSKENPILIKP